MRRFVLALATGASMIGAGGEPANAQFYKSGDLSITGNVAGTNDYVFRGFSQNARDFTVQANIDLSYKYFYAGMFISGINFGRDNNGLLVKDSFSGGRNVADVEIDLYAGFKYPLTGKLEIDVGTVGYVYPNSYDGRSRLYNELDYIEAKVGLTYKATDALTLSGVVFVTPEYTNRTGTVYTLEGSASYALPTYGKVATTLSALIGYQAGDSQRFKVLVANGRDSYFYWNAGSTFTFDERFSIDVRYWSTDVKDNNAAGGYADRFCSGVVLQCDQSVAATAKVTF